MSIDGIDTLLHAPKNTPRDRDKRDVGKRRHRTKPRADVGRVHDVMRARVVPWRFLDLGTVVLARVPYDDLDDYKVRPLVVLSADPDMAQGLPSTTSPRRRRRPAQYVEVIDLDSAGLTRPTGVRLTAVRLLLPDVIAVLDGLGPRDLDLLSHHPTGPVAA
jgi:hypothetical protein